ncbi:MAG: HAD-IIA family hydrolase [Candidatus Hadarchaeaceae archaeon]|nr:HAD-IIA family hydrolase [Hadesarchaea archaeon]
MRELTQVVDRISVFILDMDGVLYLGKTPIKGAAETIRWLRKRGKRIVFTTNSSAETRRAQARKLARMGIAARESEIITSGFVAALYLRKRSPRAKVYIVGEKGLRLEFERAGLKLVPYERAEEATHVVVGIDRKVNNKKLTGALRALLGGAKFIATNADATYPTEDGLLPGAGTMIGALEGCSGKKPSVVFGKPSPRMIKIALGILHSKPSKAAIVGDRLDTDIIAGKLAGVTTILVLSGVSTRQDIVKFRRMKIIPDFVIDGIKDLVHR